MCSVCCYCTVYILNGINIVYLQLMCFHVTFASVCTTHVSKVAPLSKCL